MKNIINPIIFIVFIILTLSMFCVFAITAPYTPKLLIAAAIRLIAFHGLVILFIYLNYVKADSKMYYKNFTTYKLRAVAVEYYIRCHTRFVLYPLFIYVFAYCSLALCHAIVANKKFNSVEQIKSASCVYTLYGEGTHLELTISHKSNRTSDMDFYYAE